MMISLRMALLILGGLMVLWVIVDGWRHAKSRKMDELDEDEELINAKRIQSSESRAKRLRYKAPEGRARHDVHAEMDSAHNPPLAVSPLIEDEDLSQDHQAIIKEAISESILPPSLVTVSPVPPTPSLHVKEVTQPERRMVLVINVMAKRGKAFPGYDLLQALLACGLRYGEMNIFHRHEKVTGQGLRLFSCACATKPGTFDLNSMGTFACKGLSLFMELPAAFDAVKVFEIMLKTTRQLAHDLNGEVQTEDRKLFTDQEAIVYRRRILHMLSQEVSLSS